MGRPARQSLLREQAQCDKSIFDPGLNTGLPPTLPFRHAAAQAPSQ